MNYQVPSSWFSRRMKKIMKQRHEAGLEPNYDPKTGKVKGKKEMILSENHELDDLKNEKLFEDEEERIKRICYF